MIGVGTLLRHHWRQHRLPLLLMAGAIGLFELLLTRIAPSINELGWIANFLGAFPPALRALVGEDVAVSALGFLTIGYNHPFLLLLLSLWVVRVSSASLAGEVGRGTIDLLATRPITRSAQVTAGFLALAAGTALLAGAAWIGTAAGLATRALAIGPRPFAAVAIMLWLLFVAWGAVGLLVSATRRDAGSAIAWTAGLVAASFVLEYLARLWATISELRPFSLFAYYRPQPIVAGGLDVWDAAALAGVAALALGLAYYWYGRRDL